MGVQIWNENQAVLLNFSRKGKNIFAKYYISTRVIKYDQSFTWKALLNKKLP